MTLSIVKAYTVVSITYVIRDEAGEICEYRDIPVTYVHGRNSPMFPKIERALDGRAIGDKAVVKLQPEEAFGLHDPNLVFTDAVNNVPEELRFIGKEFEAENDQGARRQFRVTKIENGLLTVDANHPLSGKALSYEVTVVGVRDASAEELRTGQAEPDLTVLQ